MSRLPILDDGFCKSDIYFNVRHTRPPKRKDRAVEPIRSWRPIEEVKFIKGLLLAGKE